VFTHIFISQSCLFLLVFRNIRPTQKTTQAGVDPGISQGIDGTSIVKENFVHVMERILGVFGNAEIVKGEIGKQGASPFSPSALG